MQTKIKSPYYNHNDLLNSSSATTNSAGTLVETLDYYPYGGIRLNTKTTSFSQQRKYIGQEYDTDTGLNYLNARYYNSARGQFISQDPMFWRLPLELLLDPQQQNSYSYARSNPIVMSDPGGLLTVIAPGTKHNKKTWSEKGAAKNFIKSVEKTFGEKATILNWSGKNTKSARQEAANTLVRMIKDHKFSEGEKLNIIGHSHGGNIGILASQMTDRKIDNLVTLGTPVRSDYQPNYEMISKHVNVYSNLDPVQIIGGQLFAKGGIGINISPLGSSYGFVPAQRTFSGAENINVSRETKNPLTAHFDLWGVQSVWSSINSSFNE